MFATMAVRSDAAVAFGGGRRMFRSLGVVNRQFRASMVANRRTPDRRTVVLAGRGGSGTIDDGVSSPLPGLESAVFAVAQVPGHLEHLAPGGEHPAARLLVLLDRLE